MKPNNSTVHKVAVLSYDTELLRVVRPDANVFVLATKLRRHCLWSLIRVVSLILPCLCVLAGGFELSLLQRSQQSLKTALWPEQIR